LTILCPIICSALAGPKALTYLTNIYDTLCVQGLGPVFMRLGRFYSVYVFLPNLTPDYFFFTSLMIYKSLVTLPVIPSSYLRALDYFFFSLRLSFFSFKYFSWLAVLTFFVFYCCSITENKVFHITHHIKHIFTNNYLIYILERMFRLLNRCSYRLINIFGGMLLHLT